MYEPFDMSVTECERLLRAGLVGRVALSTSTGPHIIPVNYAVVDDAVVLRTAPYTLLGRSAHGSQLALEVDHFDYEYQRGWSVVATGRSEVVEDAAELEHIGATWNPRTWVSGGRTLYVRIRWTDLTGRRLGKDWDPLANLPVRRSG
jgi:nitroimidazol reductase NimA-like FMN-containing flavoprotein (pyridoxamine 5'-phosphate oxidase superfamily)